MEESVFLDMVVSQPQVLNDAAQEKGDEPMRLRFKVTRTNVINDNNRLYPDPVMDSALERSKPLIDSNRMVGESPHPKYGLGKNGQVFFDTSIQNGVIKWYNQFKDKEGNVFADGEVLDTALGRDLKAHVKAGIPVGVSLRSTGNGTQRSINGVMIDVATKLDIHSYDIVMNPATAGCEVVEVLTDSQVMEIMNDDVQITAAKCPSCGNEMTPMDPDGDGDLDFYDCPTCKEVYIPEESKSVFMQASQALRKLNNDPDYDGYRLARDYQQNRAVMADSQETQENKEVSEDMSFTPEQLRAVLDSPELAALIEAKAKTLTQPLLDAAEVQKKTEEAEKRRQEVQALMDSKKAEMKGKVSDETIQVIMDSVTAKASENKEAAEAIIDAAIAVASQNSAAAKLDSMGFKGEKAEGHVHVEVTNEPKPWAGTVQSMLDSFDRVASEQGHIPDASIRKVNKPIIDKIITHMENQLGLQAFADSKTFMDSQVVNNDAVSVTTAQLLNQPTIQQALLIQSFQDVESLQFLATETFSGSEVRWPVETFTSAATIDPASGAPDLFVDESAGIPESVVNLAWLSFNPAWRRNAISITHDVAAALRSGPAKYDAIARGTYHIAFDKRRKLDIAAYLEMIMASDEYQPLAVTNETIAAADIAAGAAGTNVAYVAKSNNGGAATTTKGANPIVRPRTKKRILPTGQTETVKSNTVACTVGGTALTQGYLDANGNVQGGTFAIDYENGLWYFTAGAGLNPGAATPVLPVCSYSAVTNLARFSAVVPDGTDADKYYNTLLQLITSQTALMGSAPRFNRPNLGIMSLNVAALIENASMWYKLNNPDIGRLSGLADSTLFGERSGVNLARINAPWAAGDGRILLGQKGATRYGIETGYQIKGPYPKYDANQQIVDAELFYGSENSVLATPQVIDTDFNIINPKFRSIKITY